MINRNWIVLLLMIIRAGDQQRLCLSCVISQGNLIKEEDLVQLEVGMTKNQVRFLLGTPMIDDPFTRSGGTMSTT